jgi:hypothetical protein
MWRPKYPEYMVKFFDQYPECELSDLEVALLDIWWPE